MKPPVGSGSVLRMALHVSLRLGEETALPLSGFAQKQRMALSHFLIIYYGPGIIIIMVLCIFSIYYELHNNCGTILHINRPEYDHNLPRGYSQWCDALISY